MHFGFYQKECHRLLNEAFDNKASGYKWLYDNFKLRHFSELQGNNKEHKKIIQDIYDKLLVKTIFE
jgi:hypothetical protein